MEKKGWAQNNSNNNKNNNTSKKASYVPKSGTGAPPTSPRGGQGKPSGAQYGPSNTSTSTTTSAAPAPKRAGQSLQSGTGPHFDCNPHCLWKKQLVSVPGGASDFGALDRWRPFQGQVPLSAQGSRDSGLEALPGCHLFCEAYYAPRHTKAGEGLFIPPRHYNCKLTPATNSDLLPFFYYVKRIPPEWDESKLKPLPSMGQISQMTRPEICTWIKDLYNELKALDKTTEYPQEGDYIIWDTRVAHQNGDKNSTNKVRQTFYHAYLLTGDVNLDVIEGIKESREVGVHPPDFPKSHCKIETNGYKACSLSPLGKSLYHLEEWSTNHPTLNAPISYTLNPKQIAFFKRYGFVTIQNCVPLPLIQSLKAEINLKMLKIAGIDVNHLEKSTPEQWRKVCGAFGGMLEFYYLENQERLRENENLYWITVQLLENTYYAQNNQAIGFNHPFQNLNPRYLWVYVDRMNYRLPEKLMHIIESKDSFL